MDMGGRGDINYHRDGFPEQKDFPLGPISLLYDHPNHIKQTN